MVFKKVYFVCLFVFLFISFCVGDFMYVRVCVHIHVLVCVRKSIFLQKWNLNGKEIVLGISF